MLYSRTGHRWEYTCNTAHAHCMLDAQGYKDTQRICTTYWFSSVAKWLYSCTYTYVIMNRTNHSFDLLVDLWSEISIILGCDAHHRVIVPWRFGQYSGLLVLLTTLSAHYLWCRLLYNQGRIWGGGGVVVWPSDVGVVVAAKWTAKYLNKKKRDFLFSINFKIWEKIKVKFNK